MKMTVIGTGYVGLVSGACLAEMGNDVLCVDVDESKVALLQRGQIPIFEPGLQAMVERNRAAGRLQFSTDIARGVHFGTVQFIAVSTPPSEDGSANVAQVLAAARAIGETMTDYKLLVDKSTVPVGTADRVQAAVAQALAERGTTVPFSVVSNPEFLKEGAAIEDFMRPDRILVGVDPDDGRAVHLMRAIYAPYQRSHERLIVTDRRSAELTKYAANAMLATRISFMNELALLAERVGADIEHVRRGIGADPRIGYHFLYAGCGYGGSCLPKDVKALIKSAADLGQDLKILSAVEAANERQKHVLVDKIVRRFGPNLTGHRFALWGLAFKPETDDMREATSRIVIRELLERGARVVAHDPAAMDAARELFGDLPALAYAPSAMDAVEGADALVIVTEWKAFRSPDFAQLRRQLRQPVVIDGRNLFDPASMQQAGLEYLPIGRPMQVTRAPVSLVADFEPAELAA